MLLLNSGLENHPTGKGNLNQIHNGNWLTLNNMFSPAYGLTASQTTNTVTASAAVFRLGTGSGVTAEDVGAVIRFTNGTLATITAVTDSTHAVVTPSQTVSAQSFTVYRTDQTAETALARGLTKQLRMVSADTGKVPRWNNTTKRFDLVNQTGYGVAAGEVVIGAGAATEATSSANLKFDTATSLLTVTGLANITKTLYGTSQASTSSGANTTLDGALGNVFDMTIAVATTAIDMNNVKTGARYVFVVRQDGTGGRAVTWAAKFKFPKSVAPEINTAASQFTLIYGVAVSATEIICFAGQDYLLKTGGTLTGFLTLHADPSSAMHAATKQFVESIANGLDIKGASTVATTAALAANTRTGNDLDANANGAFGTIDGQALTANASEALASTLLVKDEATLANNGRFFLANAGSAGTKWKLTRCADSDTSAEVTNGMTTYISSGTANGGKEYTLSTADPITLNTTGLVFTQRTAILADGAVTDPKIGNRTVDDTLATPADTGTLTQLLSWIVGRVKGITGEAGWKDAPAATISDINSRFLSAWGSGTSFLDSGNLVNAGFFGCPDIGTIGSGSYFIWYGKLAGFRAGVCTADEWDSANWGDQSWAGGYSAIAKGDISFAFGFGVEANGVGAVTFGGANINGGDDAMICGGNSITITTAGDFAASLGGRLHSISGNDAATLGGWGLIAQGATQVVCGTFNVAQGTTGFLPAVAGDQAFIVGNGPDDANRHNAFAITNQGHLNLCACLQHASPLEGQFWFDDSRKQPAFYTGIGKHVVSSVVSQNNGDSNTVSNTTTETVFNTTFNLNANTLSVGKRIRIRAAGKYSSDASAPGNITLRIKAGSTVLVAIPATAMAASKTDEAWQFDAIVVCRVTGASGTVWNRGTCQIGSALQTVRSAGAVTIDTTAGTTLQASVQFSVADADNNATVEDFCVEVLN